MTVTEYLEIYKRCPSPFTDSKYHQHYEGELEDYNKLVEYNKKLTTDYPFLIPKNRWTGLVSDDYDYSFTELDSIPEGWRIAFGIDMCEEIKQALLKAQEKDPKGGYQESWITTNYDSDRIIPYLEGYSITQIKEKYGTLRWYDSGAPAEVYDIINKYEKISATTCINCGKPAVYESTGWISPFCEECAMKIAKKEECDVETLFSKLTD